MSLPLGQPTRREFIGQVTAAALAARATQAAPAQEPALPKPGVEMTIIDFEKTLARMRFQLYHHPPTDILDKGFRPIGGSLADFCVVHHEGRDHFFYIERRLQEGTPFFPGHEIYFGHASTPDLFTWEVHDPVMLIRPGTWEEGHVWAPFIITEGREHLMFYTGLNRHLSQDLGIASSTDLFEWKRWESNPISPCKDAAWAAWWTDDIASCRDPHLVRHDGRVWMVYTANTREGAACLALTSTTDYRQWTDHGPILVGNPAGYEPRLWGGHLQGSLESANLSYRNGRWVLIVNSSIRDKGRGGWIVQSDRIDRFRFDQLQPFWEGAGCVEVVRDRGDESLLAGLAGGHLKFGVVDWSKPIPSARFVASREELSEWQAS